eukprot:SAG25_NODE_8108_length_440_cov_0.580645_1_plen_140_part_01
MVCKESGRLTELSGQRKLVRDSKRLLWLQAVSSCGGSACGWNAAEHRRLHCQSICASALCRCYASALTPRLFLLLKAEVHALSREVVVVRVGADTVGPIAFGAALRGDNPGRGGAHPLWRKHRTVAATCTIRAPPIVIAV